MNKELSLTELTKSFEKDARSDQTVTGLWSALKNEGGLNREITIQREDGSAEQTVFSSDGKIRTAKGTIVFERKEVSGHPQRVTIFRSERGEDIILNMREF